MSSENKQPIAKALRLITVAMMFIASAIAMTSHHSMVLQLGLLPWIFFGILFLVEYFRGWRG